MMSWFDDSHHGTRDLDLLDFGDRSEAAMLATFQDTLAQDTEDGVVFDPETLRFDRITEEHDYGGLRPRVIASVGGARINLTIDIGFGDALETVIAEKFQAIVVQGRAKSRMKDFYEIWIVRRSFSFDGDRIAQAIAATFARRKSPVPTDLPDRRR